MEDRDDGHSETHAETIDGHPLAKRAKQSEGSASAAAEAPSASAAASLSALPPNADASLQSVQRRCQQLSRSLQWTEVLLSTDGPIEDPKIILKLLQADAARVGGPLVSLSHPIKVNYSTHHPLIFLVIWVCDSLTQ
jgi:hypothetical protein